MGGDSHEHDGDESYGCPVRNQRRDHVWILNRGVQVHAFFSRMSYSGQEEGGLKSMLAKDVTISVPRQTGKEKKTSRASLLPQLRGQGILLFSALVMQGCIETSANVLEAHQAGEGTAAVYDLEPVQAWDVAKAVFRWNKAELIEEHRSERYMLANIPVFEGAGAICGAWLEPVDGQKTKVTVINKRREPTNPITPLTEGGFHADFKRAVEILKSGKSLPSARPSGF